ncbi:23S rRNA (uracil(1939)-C(5))-methyltransferase RlmD [Companilactobacillus alimentarius]|uniref:23S rRNA (Uracil-5-)-methyltransferase RumA n=1 Tax=Companilactobacillus alimentarius DSM 20249 TaxID=1423720 RepID=A0A2K9HH65_9LACO|nr:23S rRNA (uracil(1939)-C(5))-methyltransferase RlmD [Companilactobacillus alimentarius]AUI71728.1 23S rRNA (uracil-5-)-methyltransferase RumA [Companilactobacillus alimentarius DSM 20249]KRK76539.1 tRNA (uracil-5-)-methyltransferase [Companilactobacillus alimentarius DSM 20249]MDT6953275.1 23S rRNA (uracil(1939)-C(5))-methyltransferase RlmD [Companilactobacillus alimentarius]GEO45556.1 23S rRNA (uracil-5-)-methyltransferase RumA [Companilactobacillus alimentarius]
MDKPNLKKNQKIDLEIQDLSYEGKGVAKVDDFTLFVDNALPNETVNAVITRINKNFGFARTLKVLKESPDRVHDIDAIYAQTGIAPLSHLKYDKQLEFKHNQVVTDMEKIGLKNVTVNDTVGMESPFNYRNKAQVPVRQINGKLTTGFYRRRSHDLVPMENFLIQDVKIDAEIIKVRDVLRKYKVRGYDEQNQKGQIRTIMVRRAYFTGEMMVVLVSRTRDISHYKDIAKEIMDNPEVKSLYLNVNSKNTNVIFGQEMTLLAGKKYIDDKILGHTYRISPRSFYQVNPVQTQKLYQMAIDKAELTGKENVVDAYSGIGTIGISLADKAKHVTGIEVIEDAVKDADQNAKLNNIENADFVVGKTEDVLNEWAKNNMSVDVLMVDPPRKGLANSLIDSLKNIKPKKIVYISCNPATLARDLSLLSDTYEIGDITPVDMFPMANHIESVVGLDLK